MFRQYIKNTLNFNLSRNKSLYLIPNSKQEDNLQLNHLHSLLFTGLTHYQIQMSTCLKQRLIVNMITGGGC